MKPSSVAQKTAAGEVSAMAEVLRREGFRHVFEWRDAPGTEYPAHSHRDRVSFFVVAGSLEFRVNDAARTVIAGERLDVLPGVEHSATVGPDGCVFVVGEMVEGDS